MKHSLCLLLVDLKRSLYIRRLIRKMSHVIGTVNVEVNVETLYRESFFAGLDQPICS